jgi:hypothetical protein
VSQTNKKREKEENKRRKTNEEEHNTVTNKGQSYFGLMLYIFVKGLKSQKTNEQRTKKLP